MARKKSFYDDPNAIFKVVDIALRDVAEKEMRSYRRTSQSWKRKPSWKTEKNPNGFGYSIVTDSQVWLWVNYGTKPHTIGPTDNPTPSFENSAFENIDKLNKKIERERQPRVRGLNENQGRLAWQRNFNPKTLPGKIQSKEGGKSGKFIVLPPGYEVNHPGIEARRFDLEIGKKQDERFVASVLKALDKILKD